MLLRSRLLLRVGTTGKELMPPVERNILIVKWTVAGAAVILLALGSSVSLYFLGTPAVMKFVMPNFR